MAQTIAETNIPLNRQMLAHVNEMNAQGIITGTSLAAISSPGTIAKLRAIGDSLTLPPAAQRFYEQYQKAVDRTQAAHTPNGSFTDAGVETVRAAGAGTALATLRALFTTQDANLPAGLLNTTVD